MSQATADDSRAYADLVVYRWSQLSLTGGNGVGPVSTSLDRDDLVRWDARLTRLVWAAQGSTLPGHMYLTYGDEAAVLRKLSVRDANGRGGSTLTHVLIGPAAELDLGLALTLCRSAWNWLPPGGAEGTQERLPPVPLDRLRPHLAEDTAELERLAAEVPDALLAPVTAAIMDAPGRPLTIVGSPVPAEVLIKALSGWLGRLTAGEWTFATREESDAGTGIPRFVFLERERDTPHLGAARQVVRADETGEESDLTAARGLLRQYRRRGSQGIDRLRPERPLSTAEEVRVWRERTCSPSGMVMDVAGMLTDAVYGVLEPDERAFLRARASIPQVELHLRRTKPEELTALVKGWSPLRPGLSELAPVRDALHAEALHRVLRAATDPGAHTAARTEPDLAPALKAARPDAALVQECLDEEIELARRRALPVDVLRVLLVAHSAGLPAADLVLAQRRLTRSDTPVHVLLAQVDQVAMAHRTLARELLRACVQRRTRRDRRAPIAHVLAEHRFLARAVEVMAEGQPHLAVQYFKWLLHCLTGDESVTRRDVHEAVHMAGPGLSDQMLAALLQALRDLGNRSAVQAVTDIASNEFFRRNLSPRRGPQYPAEHSAPPRRETDEPGARPR
ncbi:hypothetical protein [Streptomyces sp. NPDC048191]|uniref:hypothetical protein n=1 Tax=Streptomyces sp. NPDC048191 TaxID=3155484 RepID=UPI0033E3E0CE